LRALKYALVKIRVKDIWKNCDDMESHICIVGFKL